MPLGPTRLVGHGIVAVPHVPFRIERTPQSATTLRVLGEAHDEIVDLAAIARGDAVSDLVDVAPGPSGPWRIETTIATCCWPDGFAIASDPDDLSPFLLVGPNDAMIWFAGPVPRAKAWPIERLATDDQRVRAVADRGDDARLDVDYVEEGAPWWQRRYVRTWGDDRAVVLTAQARAIDEELARSAIDAVEATLVATQMH
jgi:hypothetical protein